MRRRRQGLTLIEVLIAVTLVSLLSMGLLFATRVGLNSMDAVQRRVLANRRTTGAQRILEAQLGGFMPVVAFCGGMLSPEGGVPAPFFQGEPQILRFVTTYSLSEGLRGVPRVAEIFVAPAAEEGGVRLLLNEYSYGGPYGAGQFCFPPLPDAMSGGLLVRFRPVEALPSSFVLADKLAYARFAYQKTIDPEVPDVWLPRWLEPALWPRAIRLEMGPLAADPSSVQPTSITFPMRVTRLPLEIR